VRTATVRTDLELVPRLRMRRGRRRGPASSGRWCERAPRAREAAPWRAKAGATVSVARGSRARGRSDGYHAVIFHEAHYDLEPLSRLEVGEHKRPLATHFARIVLHDFQRGTDQGRQIELQVRTAYSDFIQARETLDSQLKVQEEAEEALREAKQRAEAGTGTQLDVLDVETSLTQARTTQIQALHDYATARARFERAVGSDLVPVK